MTETTDGRKKFFWSMRTLRVTCFDADNFEAGTEDVLGVGISPQHRCVYAYGEYGPLIVKLLNEHFAKVSSK